MGLKIQNVSKSFGEKKAVNKISFEIDRPGVFGLLGTNGAGKTTTIRMILGILQKDQGEITWNGQVVNERSMGFGYLPEERGIYPKAKIKEQLFYFGRLRSMTKDGIEKSLKYWFERLGVEEYLNATPEILSKGNQQKIQFITALLHNPEMIIMDEPFSGLDPVNTDLFKSVIKELIKANKMIIMSSHQMATVEEHCDDILILKDGDTILQGNLKKIKQSYGRTNLFIDCEGNDTESVAQSLGVVPVGFNEFKIKSDDQGNMLLKTLLEKGYRIDRYEIREPSLHEIFVEKVGV